MTHCRIFVCATCDRILAGCSHLDAVEEKIECCAFCYRNEPKPGRPKKITRATIG